jgi:HAD superfamily hydrolase (TIGR01509 family)
VRHFPVRIYSNQVGASKPSPAIYEAALAALGTRPSEALYIDDIVEFAEAARRLGLDAIRFENPEQLADEFLKPGLIT